MRIALDARAFSWTGIGRYIQNLVREFDTIPTQHTFTLLVNDTDRDAIRQVITTNPQRFSLVSVESSYYSWQEQTKLLWQLNRVSADLFHFTHFNIPVLFRRPFVVTIHDITRFIFPGQSDKSLLKQIVYEYIFHQSVTKARSLITVSDTTYTDLHQLPLSLPKIHETIPEGVQAIFFKPASRSDRNRIRQLLRTQQPYLLFVGVWMEHKNIERILEAYALVRQRHPTLQLVMTGVHKHNYVDVLARARAWQVEQQVIFPGFIAEELLPALYQEATAFLFPSLYEGFGLPALEAAASGIPVITANVSGPSEVMAGAAELVNPEDTSDIVRGIHRVLADDAYRSQCIASGRQHAAQFTWRTCAHRTLALYEKSI